MGEDTDYKALYEQVVGEYERLLEKHLNYEKDSIFEYFSYNGLKTLLNNKYFVWGVLAGCIALLIVVIVYGDKNG